MIYQQILDALIALRRGFLAAVLLDSEGETVVASRRYGESHDHQVLGAYQGIYLRDLARAFRRCGLGSVERFFTSYPQTRVFTEPLVGGYYLVLLTDRSLPAGLTWHDIGKTATQLSAIL